MIDTPLSSADALLLSKLEKQAATQPLAFRIAARHSAAAFPRATRRDLAHLDTKDTRLYQLFIDWSVKLADSVTDLLKVRHSTTLSNALAKHLQLSSTGATTLAQQLVDDRLVQLRDDFIGLHYGHNRRANAAADTLLGLPPDRIVAIRDQYIAYYLHQRAARHHNLAFYDAEAPRSVRRRSRRRERRQIKKYRAQQADRLAAIRDAQQVLTSHHRGIIGRIFALQLESVLALDAYRTYRKRLDALKPASRTPAKTLALFTAATKPLRDAHARTLADTHKLADLQRAQQAMDEVLVELFDMTDTERNTLMTQLKEYRDLDREALVIVKEQTDYPVESL